jgi:hypothetical protein
LIGAYFTHEYSIEESALFNPSIVPAPDQSGLASGAVRFVMSLRAVGEGHLSSIEFRSGVLGANGEIEIHDAGPRLVSGRRTPPSHFDKRHFSAKLEERRDQRVVFGNVGSARGQVHAGARGGVEHPRSRRPASGDLVQTARSSACSRRPTM